MIKLHHTSVLALALVSFAASAQAVRTENNISLELVNKIAAATVAACSADKFNVTATEVARYTGLHAAVHKGDLPHQKLRRHGAPAGTGGREVGWGGGSGF